MQGRYDSVLVSNTAKMQPGILMLEVSLILLKKRPTARIFRTTETFTVNATICKWKMCLSLSRCITKGQPARPKKRILILLKSCFFPLPRFLLSRSAKKDREQVSRRKKKKRLLLWRVCFITNWVILGTDGPAY